MSDTTTSSTSKMEQPGQNEAAQQSSADAGLSQPWKKFISVEDGKHIDSSTGEVRLQLERDQHKGVGGPICQAPMSVQYQSAGHPEVP